MATARTSTLANLRGSIERIEAHGDAYAPDRIALGHAEVDATLQGASAETMAASVAAPLERRFGQIPGVTQLTSMSRPILIVKIGVWST